MSPSTAAIVLLRERLERDDDGESVASTDVQPATSPPTCRICLQTTREQLLQPCNCRGSQAMVHFTCVARWIETSKSTTCSVCASNYEGLELVREPLPVTDFLRNNQGYSGGIGAFVLFFLFMLHLIVSGFVLVRIAQHDASVPKIICTMLTLGNLALSAFVAIVCWLAGAMLYASYHHWTRENFAIKVYLRSDIEQGKQQEQLVEQTDIENS